MNQTRTVDFMLLPAISIAFAVFIGGLEQYIPLWAVIGAGVVLLITGSFYFVRSSQPRNIEARPIAVTLRSPAEKARYANRAVIAFVSLYRAPDDLAAHSSPEDWRSWARNHDQEKLRLPESNLATLIEAVECHRTRLEHCWLISTTSLNEDSPGSEVYAGVMVDYLRQQLGGGIEYHYGPTWSVTLDDDALVGVKTYDMIREIYSYCASQGILSEDVIADFTGCPRSMTLGMILASMRYDQDIQLIGTRYDAGGRPVGAPFPVVFGFRTDTEV